MASAQEDRISEHLKCAECTERYEEPRVLSCQHFFCKKFLDGLVTREGSTYTITCPECREETEVENGDVANLKTKVLSEMALLQEDEYYVLSMRGGEYGVLYSTCDRQMVHFIIQGWSKNPTFRESRKKTKVKITAQRQSAAPKYPTVKDNKDGTYSFSYCPGTKGVYSIEIIINGRQIDGSPFGWEVRDRPQLSINSKPNALSGSCFLDEHHSWKIQYIYPEGGSGQTETFVEKHTCIDMGVAFDNGRTFCWSRDSSSPRFSKQKRPFNRYSSNRGNSSLQALQQGDVLVFYLDIASSQLLIFNERSKESDRFVGVGRNVQPYIAPNCSKYFRIPVSSIDT